MGIMFHCPGWLSVNSESALAGPVAIQLNVRARQGEMLDLEIILQQKARS
jgi:hypothetical protein